MKEQVSGTRKIHFIDKKFQFKFILNYVLLIVAGTLLFNLVAYFVLNRHLGESLYSAHLALNRTQQILMPTLVYLSITLIVILSLAAVVVTLLVSHKICGPMFAIVRYLKMVAEGKLNFEARLRTKDQTAVVAETLTEMIKTLNGRIVVLKENTDNLQKGLQRLNALAGEGGNTAEIIKAAHGLNEHARALEERLALFQTE